MTPRPHGSALLPVGCPYAYQFIAARAAWWPENQGIGANGNHCKHEMLLGVLSHWRKLSARHFDRTVREPYEIPLPCSMCLPSCFTCRCIHQHQKKFILYEVLRFPKVLTLQEDYAIGVFGNAVKNMHPVTRRWNQI